MPQKPTDPQTAEAQSDPYELWTPIIRDSRCPRCGSTEGFNIAPAGPGSPHHSKLVCHCGAFIRWLPAPKQEPARYSTSWARAHWIRHDNGLLICSVCGVRQDQTYCEFVIHHRERVEDNPQRERDLYNTLPLCKDCHTVAEAMRAHRLHVLGRSARDG